MPPTPIYELCPTSDWLACQRTGMLPWSPVDTNDAFIHLSAPHQVHETAAKHFRGRTDLVLLEVDPARLPRPRPACWGTRLEPRRAQDI